MKLKHILMAAVVVIAGVVAFMHLHQAEEDPRSVAGERRHKVERRRPRTVSDMKRQRDSAQTAKPKKETAEKRPLRERIPLPDDFTAQERSEILAMEDALDYEDFEAVAAACEAFQASTNPAVRLRAVESLGWFGEQALPELTPYLADPDDEVRDSALQQWGMGISEMEDADMKSGLIEAAMGVMSKKEILEEISFYLNELPNTIAVDVQVALINAGNPTAAEVAAEAYEFTTGEKYVDIDSAQRWVDENPDDFDDLDDE